jgi:hypothetical protein
MTWLLLVVLALQIREAAPFDASAVSVARPKVVCELDLGVLKGAVRRLAWSPNRSSIYIQTTEGEATAYDYIVDLETGEISRAFGEPSWAIEYWARKSAFEAPGDPSLRLEISESNRRTRPMPFSGGFANGGAQTVDPRNPVDAYENEVTVRFLGLEIGNWINGAPMAGDTFGWGPDGSGALVFSDRSGRLTIVDRARRMRAVDGVKDATLPAWSSDGAALAFLQKAGRKKYRLMTAAVSR